MKKFEEMTQSRIMKKFEEMTQDEQEAFIVSLECDVEGDSYVKTPTFEIFCLAVQCMGYDSAEQFLTEHDVKFEALRDKAWFICGNLGSSTQLYIED